MEEKCTLTDQELIDACKSLVVKLAAGTEKWRMTVPVDFNRDSDILLFEVITRFKERISTPYATKPDHSYNRDENSLEGRAAIGFYEWMQRTNMEKTDIPINIKWRMFVDQLIVKQRNNQ